ncbi:MAG TPA: hypothetical protein VJK72_05855 [Candidatus Nanoarchaeia archaeon]|nr:hypothetical protein [Candidatus Nanoarchaeia archaeon]
MDPLLYLVNDTRQQGKQSLVFVESKLSAEKTAEDIARALRMKQSVQPACAELAEKILGRIGTPTKQCKRLSICIKSGVAFHHAGLLSDQRDLIEKAFRDGIITTLCATPTLVYGVSTPAYRVILKSLKRFSGSWGMSWIPVLEYLQFCGRAGRPEFHDDHGEAIAIAKDDIEHDKIHAQYILGKPEEITSKLASEPVLRTYVLSLLASGFAASREHLVDFFSRTFWAHQYQDMLQLEKIIDKMIALLTQWNFVKTSASSDFVSAAELGKNSLDVTPLGKRVAELYLDPYTAHRLLTCLQKVSQPATFGILQAISHTLEMRPLLRLRVKDHESVQESLLAHSHELLQLEPNLYDSSYDEFLESVKTALFFSEWIEEKSEEQLLETYSIRPGEIQSKVNAADWLLYSVGELLPYIRSHHMMSTVKKLRMRVQYGAKEELLTLLRFRGIGRVRARRLYKNALKDVGDLRKVQMTELARIIGKATAESVKNQLGEAI